MNHHLLMLIMILVTVDGVTYAKQGESGGYYQESNHNVDIQISYIDSPLIQIQWCGLKNRKYDAVLVLTSKGTVYRSDDNGRQWTKLSETFQRKALMVLEDSDVKVGVVNNIIRGSDNLVLFTGSEMISWISLDCGKSITVINSGRQLRDFMWHPTQSEWLLASSWKRCPTQDTQCKSYKELVMSQDYGTTWNQLATYVIQYAWGLTKAEQTGVVPEERIIVSFDPVGKGHQSLATWNTQANLYYSDDFFQSRTMSVANGARFLLTDAYLFVAQVTNPQTQEVSLWVSPTNNILGYSFDVIDADAGLLEHSYQVLDTSENQVFMIVNHLKPSSPMGVIYISDSTGTRYSRSLENAVRLDQGGSEFYRVLGLEGIYLANVYSDDQAKLYEKQVMEAHENGLVITDKQGFKDEDLAKFKQTRITFDKGGRWVPLKVTHHVNIQPPTVDSDGKPIKCDPKMCSLHLHINQAYHQFGPIYSQQQAIGIIVATGSIGKYLSTRQDQVNTYLSRDGGLTWHEIHKGSHIYELSDHGGLMLMTSDQENQQEVKYSWNEGLNWSVMQFSDEKVEVQNIVTEPLNQHTRFILYGSAIQEVNSVKQDQGILVTVDLDELHQRKCVLGSNNEFDADKDYELWTPSGLVNPECLFGKKVTYIRRKREAQCYNVQVFEKPQSVEPCPCSQEDYECDLGFKFNIEQQQCLPINGTLSTLPPAECTGVYQISSGYRKVAGNICQGGLQKPAITVACPNRSGITDWLLVIVASFALYWACQNQDKIRSLLSSAEEGRLPVQHEPQRNDRNTRPPPPQSKFNAVQLEENEKGLGYQEFDEDLLERDDDVQVEVKHDESELI